MAGVRTKPQDRAQRLQQLIQRVTCPGSRGGGRCTCVGGAPAALGDSQDEGAGFLEPTEGLEKPTGVLTLPGQSFDGLDDLVMQIAESEGVGGRSDREETELEQWALHLGVPGTVGTILRPLEPKHAAWEACSPLPVPPAPIRSGVWLGDVPPPLGAWGPLQAKWILQHGF